MTMPSYIINWEDIANALGVEGLLKVLGTLRDLSANQKTYGNTDYIPFIDGQYVVMQWKAKKATALTGISYAQSNFHPDDYWELWVDGDRIFETIYVKEIGEIKHWETVHYIKKGQTLRLIHHNNSGTAKYIWTDLEISGEGEFIEEVDIFDIT